MQIENVTFKNYRQHRNTTFQLQPGVNGVIGPNGSGKSNLIRGIQYLLTGSFPRSDGADGLVPAARNISWGADTGLLECTFVHNGIRGTIRRSLHTSSCRLTYGDVVKTKAADVNAMINSMMGTSSRVIGNYVFTHQGATAGLLKAKSADRAAMFSVLFNTDRCERTRELLNAELSTHAPADLSFSSNLLRDSIGQTTARVNELSVQIRDLQAKMATINEPEERARLVTAKANHDTYNNPNTGYAATTRYVEKLTADLRAVQEQSTELDRQEAEQKTILAELETQVVHHRTLVSQATTAGQAKLKRDAVMLRVTELRRHLETLEASPPPTVSADLDAAITSAQKTLDEVVADLTGYCRLVSNFSGGTNTCSTCGTHHITDATGKIRPVADVLAEAKSKIAQLDPWVKDTKNWIATQKASKQQAEKAARTWTETYQGVKTNLEAAQTHLADLPEIPTIDATASQRFIEQHREAQSKLHTATTAARTAHQTLVTVRTQLEQQSRWLEQLTQLPRVDYSVTEQRIKDWDNWRSSVLTLNGQFAELSKSLQNSTAQLQQLQEAETKSDTVRRYRDVLSTVIGAFHRDSYPAAVARLHFQVINYAWNAALTLLGQPYQAQILQDQTIQLQFPDGLADFYEASGGQQCCAAIAYLWAANQQFAAEAGMMFLDEPTYGIDADHIPMVADMMMNMQRAALSANLQVVIVTHDERLTRGCNYTVQLGG